MASVLAAAIAAIGLVLSTYITVRLQKVQRTVNGHQQQLERRIGALEAQLVAHQIATLDLQHPDVPYVSGDDPL